MMIEQNIKNIRSEMSGGNDNAIYTEDDIKKAVENVIRAKETGDESYYIKNLVVLSDIYKSLSMWSKNAEIQEILMELFYERRDWDELKECYQELIESLTAGHYYDRSEQIAKKWMPVFEKAGINITGKNNISDTEKNHIIISELEQKLIVVRGMNDLAEQKNILLTLGDIYTETDHKKAAGYYMEALDVSIKQNGAKCQDTLIKAICELIQVKDIDSVKKAKEMIDDVESELSGFLLGNLLLCICQDDDPKITIILLMSVMSSLDKENISEQDYKILYLISDSIAQNAVIYGSMDMMTKLAEKIKCNKNEYCDNIGNIFLTEYNNFVMNFFPRLIQNYEGEGADRVLEIIETAIKFFCIFEKTNGYAFAGNAALIFRRRKDKEKTYYYHNLAMEGYKEADMINDQMIEAMNLATAYKDFKEYDKAIALLRQNIEVAKEHNLENAAAGMCGNLAPLLMAYESDCSEEIESCFAYEEEHFRNLQEWSDLVISLLNQLGYYLKSAKKNSNIRRKMDEAMSLISKYQLAQFKLAAAKIKFELEKQGLI